MLQVNTERKNNNRGQENNSLIGKISANPEEMEIKQFHGVMFRCLMSTESKKYHIFFVQTQIFLCTNLN